MGSKQPSDTITDLPDINAEEALNTAARKQLVKLLLGYILLYLGIATLLAHRAIEIVTTKGTPFETGDLIVLGFSYTLLFNLLTTLPLLMVVGYRGLQGAMVIEKVRLSLTLCGLPLEQVNAKMREYSERNSFQAFLLPMAINLAFMVILWGSVLFSRGVGGMMEHLEVNGKLYVSMDLLLQRVAAEALIGLLLTALFSDAEGLRGKPEAWVLSLAFISGLVPDVFLRWVTQQAKRLVGSDNTAEGMFEPSELQKKITGMSFWQADRLSEEAIDSIQDLAMKDIPDLLIRTRFDPALLFSWVDRALLWNQVGDDTVWFERAKIRSASQLLFLVKRDDRPQAIETMLRSIKDAQARSQQPSGTQTVVDQPADGPTKAQPKTRQNPPAPLSCGMLKNLISGLEHGPNLHYVCNYWRHASHQEQATPTLPKALAPASEATTTSPPPSRR